MKVYKITIEPGTYKSSYLFNGNKAKSYFRPAIESRHMRAATGKTINVYKAFSLLTKDEDTLSDIQASCTCSVEEVEVKESVANRATDRQISYLRDLGYIGSANITKQEASKQIDFHKNLSRSDVDDFTGPEWTW